MASSSRKSGKNSLQNIAEKGEKGGESSSGGRGSSSWSAARFANAAGTSTKRTQSSETSTSANTADVSSGLLPSADSLRLHPRVKKKFRRPDPSNSTIIDWKASTKVTRALQSADAMNSEETRLKMGAETKAKGSSVFTGLFHNPCDCLPCVRTPEEQDNDENVPSSPAGSSGDVHDAAEVSLRLQRREEVCRERERERVRVRSFGEFSLLTP